MHYAAPPSNIEAEESLIVSLLIHPDKIPDVEDILPASAFYSPKNRVYFEAILAVRTTDLVSVSDYMSQKKIGHPASISELSKMIDKIPQSTNLIATSKIINDCALKREMIETCNRIINNVYSGDVDEALEKAQSDILRITPGMNKDTFLTMGQLTEMNFDRLERLDQMARDGRKTLNLGFKRHDAIIGSLDGPQTIYIAARPEMGKSALMLCILRNMAKDGHQIGCLSIEMPLSAIDNRMIALESNLNTLSLFTNRKNQETWQRIIQSNESKYNLPILFDGCEGSGESHITSIERKIKLMVKKGCKLVAIDQLTHIVGDGQTEYIQTTGIVKRLTALSRVVKIPLVILTQLNRELEKRANKEPIMSDLGYSGRIEQDAYRILVFYRPEIYEPDNPDLKGKVVFKWLKNRDGPTDRDEYSVEFIAKSTQFIDKGGYYGQNKMR